MWWCKPSNIKNTTQKKKFQALFYTQLFIESVPCIFLLISFNQTFPYSALLQSKDSGLQCGIWIKMDTTEPLTECQRLMSFNPGSVEWLQFQ